MKSRDLTSLTNDIEESTGKEEPNYLSVLVVAIWDLFS